MEKISITFFRNPHKFWFRRDDFFVDEEIEGFRQKVRRAMSSQALNIETWKPAIGEMVVLWQKNIGIWNRGIVESISSNGDFEVWLEDFGFPEIAKKKEIRPMPKNIPIPAKKTVREGGIFGIIPAKRKFNFTTGTIDMVSSGMTWSQDAIDLMQEAIQKADTIFFEMKDSPDINVCYGNLVFVMPNGRKFSARDILCDFSITSDTFLDVISQNFGQALVLKSGEMISSISESQNNKDFINEWVEKSVDIQHDTFDESVSTYHPPANQNPPAMPETLPLLIRKVPTLPSPAAVAHAADEWDPISINEHPIPAQQKKPKDWTPPPTTEQAPRRVRGRGIPSMCSNEDSSRVSTISLKEMRVLSDHRADDTLKLFQKSQSPRSEKPPVVESARSAKMMPDPAGMLYGKELSKKDQKKMQNVNGKQKRGKSRDDEIRQLGEVPVLPTAKRRYQRILVHCALPVKPIERISEACFRSEVHEKLKEYHISDVHRVQSHAWPHLYRGGSIVMVGRSKSGKTMAYLPTLYTRLMNDKDHEESGVELNVGARAIVICSSSQKVIQTSERFLGYHDRTKAKPEVLASYNPKDTFHHVVLLQNGYDILFTTAAAFMRLKERAKKETVDFLTHDDIRYVVIDDYDAISTNFKNELKIILKTVLSCKDERGLYQPQVIFTSSKWMPEFKMYWKKFDNPMLCIALGIESALYGGAKFSMEIMSKEHKVNAIRNLLLTEDYFTQPTMIVCNTVEEVEYLAGVLHKSSVSVMTFTFPTHEPLVIKEKAVIVCTDACIMELNVRNIQNLIHFSLPENWGIFDNRFVVCFEYYEDQVSCDKTTKDPVSIQIYLDEDNDVQLPKMVHFIRRNFPEVEISPKINACANASIQRRENAKVEKNIEMCSETMEFGQCHREHDCVYRHFFNETIDSPSDILPKKDFLRMTILAVESPIHYKAHILHTMKSHNDPYHKWTVVNRSNEYFAYQNDLNRNMMHEENQVTPASSDVKPNDIYLFKFDYNYYRVQIKRTELERGTVYVAFTAIDVPKKVDKCSSQDLFVVPAEFKDYPPQLIDIRLFGLAPNDQEKVWDRKSILKVQSWMDEVKNNNMISFIGEIQVTLKSTIYVKGLNCFEFFDTNNSNFARWSVKKAILKKHIGMELPPERIIFIQDLIDTFGHSKIDQVVTKPQKDEPREAKTKWMNVDIESLVDANIFEFLTLDEFYVQDLSTRTQLHELQQKIKTFTASADNLLPKTILAVGDCCLVPMKERFCRGKVWKETDKGEEFHVFLVDEGLIGIYSKERIFEIPRELMTDYPFFAIRCSLLGVKEPTPELSADDLDRLYENFIQGPIEKMTLQIYPIEKTMLTTESKCEIPVYSVILLAREESDIVLNRRLIKEKLAVEDPEKWPLVKKFLDEKLPEMLPEDPMVTIPENGLRDYLEFEKPPKEDTSPPSPPQDNASASPPDTPGDCGYKIFRMQPLFNAPRIEWRQNNDNIILNVTALELKDYHLIVQPAFISLCLVFPEAPQQGCVINFFGQIVPKHAKVKQKPNALIINLKKAIPGTEFMWPYLMDPPEKVSWLKPAIDVDSEAYDSEDDLREIDSDDPTEKEKIHDTVKERDSDSYDDEDSDIDINNLHL